MNTNTNTTQHNIELKKQKSDDKDSSVLRQIALPLDCLAVSDQITVSLTEEMEDEIPLEDIIDKSNSIEGYAVIRFVE